jgi:hypothetical protein
MSWQAITTDDVKAQFTSDEIAAIAVQQGTGSGPISNIDGVLKAVVAEVRDYIRSGGFALDDDEATIPIGLFNDAIAICRWRLLISLPKTPTLETDVRERAFNETMAKLMRISNQDFAVEPPVPDTIARAGTWNSENKIIMRTHPVVRPFWPAGVTPYANPDAPQDIPPDPLPQ